MKAEVQSIAEVFADGGRIHFFLPHFQREYAWTKKNWQELLDDLNGIYAESDKQMEIARHFIGALVIIYSEKQKMIPVYKLVDGQQRLTTIALLLCALRDLSPKDSELYADIQDLLLNPREMSDTRYKLLPTTKNEDRVTYKAILEGASKSNDESRIDDAYHYFYDVLGTQIQNGTKTALRYFEMVTDGLQVVQIELDSRESPFEIFESLNNKGKPLTQADLARNYIALRLPDSDQERLFDALWSPIEAKLSEQRGVGKRQLGELTTFLRHYLAYMNGVVCNEGHVYAQFRDRNKKLFPETTAFLDELRRLCQFAEYYDVLLRPEHAPDLAVREALTRLNALEFTTGYPFLLAVYHSWQQGLIERTDFLNGLAVLENYMVRRYLVGVPSNYLTNMFPLLYNAINTAHFSESLRIALLERRYPTDDQIRRNLQENNLYSNQPTTQRKLHLVLHTINRKLSKGTDGYTDLDSPPTFEHIMPQKLSPGWKTQLGADAEAIQKQYVHKLGNLTLVTQSFNSSLSNGSFAEKRERLANHALRLNSSYFSESIQVWDAAAIQTRADFLQAEILRIWPSMGGEAPAEVDDTTPRTLVIRNEQFVVDSWRSVAIQMTYYVIRVSDKFNEIAEKVGVPLTNQQPQKDRRVIAFDNGWWLRPTLKYSKTDQNYCEKLMRLAGISEEEWYT